MASHAPAMFGAVGRGGASYDMAWAADGSTGGLGSHCCSLRRAVLVSSSTASHGLVWWGLVWQGSQAAAKKGPSGPFLVAWGDIDCIYANPSASTKRRHRDLA
jgi:hypothetical protein